MSSEASRIPHRKSRSGCINCKRRRVKCDEVKPACANCIRFRMPCSFGRPQPAPNTHLAEDAPVPPPHSGRGRGRPRKVWTETDQADIQADIAAATSSSIPITTAADACSLNIVDAELLLHFTSHTAQSLAGPMADDSSMAKFWAHDVPQIGLAHHHVLHLCLAMAGYHLALSHEKPSSSRSRQRLIAAHSHYQTGVAEFTTALTALDESSTAALFASAMLVCFCRFAAGPAGPGDLAICDVDGGSPSWLPLIRGVRVMRETTNADALLFSSASDIKSSRAEEENTGLKHHPRIDWEQPLAELRSFIALSKSPHVQLYLQSMDALAAIYEATYSKSDGSCGVPPYNRFIFGWLYRMEDDFVACLERKEPLALLLLAYYSLLLRTMRNCWFMDGWCEHLLRGLSAFLCHDFAGWLQWPTEQAGLA